MQALSNAVPLGQVTYQVNEAARLLRLPDKTLRRWLDGDRRFDEVIPPLLRSAPTGDTDMTWGEFVEAGLLREYRDRRLPIRELRPLIEALRAELGTPYPLADARPLYASGRELLWRLQTEHSLDPDLFLVVTGLEAGHQLVLTSLAEEFVDRVEFEPPEVGVAARWYPLGSKDRLVVVDPRIAFGSPTIRGIRTEAIAELHDAGEDEAEIVHIYSDFGITRRDVSKAVEFERSLWRAA